MIFFITRRKSMTMWFSQRSQMRIFDLQCGCKWFHLWKPLTKRITEMVIACCDMKNWMPMNCSVLSHLELLCSQFLALTFHFEVISLHWLFYFSDISLHWLGRWTVCNTKSNGALAVLIWIISWLLYPAFPHIRFRNLFPFMESQDQNNELVPLSFSLITACRTSISFEVWNKVMPDWWGRTAKMPQDGEPGSIQSLSLWRRMADTEKGPTKNPSTVHLNKILSGKHKSLHILPSSFTCCWLLERD